MDLQPLTPIGGGVAQRAVFKASNLAHPPQEVRRGAFLPEPTSAKNILLKDVIEIGLPTAATITCLNIVLAVLACAKRVEGEAFATEDGGASIAFDGTLTHREVTFVVPGDDSVMYFVARGPDRFRKAGLVTDRAAVEGLARWVGEARCLFPVAGIQVG
jgi:hypothetical protein